MSVRGAGRMSLRVEHDGRQLPALRFSAFRLGVAVTIVALLLGVLATLASAPGTGAGRSGGDRSDLAARSAPSGRSGVRTGARGPRASASQRLVADALPERIDGSPKLLTASGSLPADCIPQPSGPPHGPYQLGLVGSVQGGIITAGAATVADITAKFCGIVTVVNGTAPCGATGSVVSPPDGQVFGSLSATLTLVPGMLPKVPFVAHAGTITGGFACQQSTNGLEVTLDATVSGSTGLFGLSCTIGPLTIPLSGVLTGPLSNASITLRSDDFAVPVVSSSPTCSGQVPANLDAIAGLPIPAGKASATLPATAALYQPSG
jgi:hypothetical protein